MFISALKKFCVRIDDLFVFIEHLNEQVAFFLGTTESIITHIVATRCNAQRQRLKKMFKTMYGRVCPPNITMLCSSVTHCRRFCQSVFCTALILDYLYYLSKSAKEKNR